MATGQEIADEARGDLHDEDATNLRWTDAKMLRYINASARQIIFLLPEAYVLETQETLIAGSRQFVPLAGIKFLGLYNVQAGVRGDAVTVVEEDALNSAFPTWQVAPITPDVEGTVLHVTHDPRDPYAFNVYPPVEAGSEFDVFQKYVAMPDAMAALADEYPLFDEYTNAAVEYVKWRMMSTDGRYGTSPDQRLEQWNNFRMALGLKPEIDRRVDPARGRAGGDTNG